MSQTWKIIIAVVITGIVVGSGVYYWQNQNSTDADLLYDNPGYRLPFAGAAIIEGYYTTVERPTSLDPSTPNITCSGFVVTDGPSRLLEALKADKVMYGTPPTIVLGSKDSSWGNINASTKENPIKILVTLNSMFEGEVIGCMSWPFNSFVEIK